MSDESTTFEEIIKALEGEVDRLESGDLSLEDALAAFEKGMMLLKQGSDALQEAEAKVERLVSVHDGQAETTALDPEVEATPDDQG